MEDKKSRFAELAAQVQACTLCPRMSQRKKVLGAANGNLDSIVVFIGEAPGRLGADRCGIPFHGDQAGRNFESFISNAGLSRDAVFITNSVLCNPRTEVGNNDPPTTTEIKNCSRYLDETLKLINPKYVVTLGTRALTALRFIEPHCIFLNSNATQIHEWHGFRLVPLYHPGSRALIWRSRSQQVQDYQALGEELRRANPIREVCA